MAFDRQPVLDGPGLLLRPMTEADREPLFKAASDPKTWAGHPVKNRHERGVFDPYFDFLLGTQETLIVIDKETGQTIGCSRYYTAPKRPDTIAVGYTFLHPDYWGGATNFEMKTLMFEHAFNSYDAVWLDIDPDNIRSQKASAKLGAEYIRTDDHDFGSGTSATYREYCVTQEAWARINAAKLGA